jgi:hypothetical protein
LVSGIKINKHTAILFKATIAFDTTRFNSKLITTQQTKCDSIITMKTIEVDDCEFRAVTRLFEEGDYCSAVSLSCSCVTRTIGSARNKYLTKEDLEGVSIIKDQNQSKVFKMLI